MRTLRELLTAPTDGLGRAGRFLGFQYKLWSHCLKLLNKNNVIQLAAALSYYTIFGMVPLAIMVVLIFHSAPAYRETGEHIKKSIYNELRLTQIEYQNPDHPEERIALTDYLDRIIDNFFSSLDKGPLGLVSAVLVIWAALRLLSIIESAFNHMWYVSRGRRFLHRIINYWALLTLVPLLLGAAIYTTTQYALLNSIEANVLAIIGPVVSFLLSWLAFFLVYLVMPNAKVQAGAALWGATVAALTWSFARWGFGIYVTKLIPYNAMYGVLGLIPLVMFWVYVTWLIVLFGLELTFATQHFETLETAEVPKAKEAEGRFIANEMTAIAIAREIAAAFANNQAPVSTDDICIRLDIPGEFGQKLLDELVARGILARTSEPRPGYLPIKEPARTRLSEVADAVAAASFAQPHPDTNKSLSEIARAQRELLAQYTIKEIVDGATPSAERSSLAPEYPPAREDAQQERPSDASGH